MINRKGFTLAEVLITLGIIGIVAILTISVMVSDIKDTAIKSRWKKAYSIIAQSYEQMLKDNSDFTISGLCNDAQCLSDLLAPYLKTSQSCTSGNIGPCWQVSSNFFEAPVYAGGMKFAFDAFNSDPDSVIVLNNGMALGFRFISNPCNDNGATGLEDCGVVVVDIDGAKGKHVPGIDLFAIHLQATGVKPFGSNGDNYNGLCTDVDKTGCSAAYLYDF